ESIGGLKGLMARADANAKVIAGWAKSSSWAANLAEDPATASNTSVCLKFTDSRVRALSTTDQTAFSKEIAGLLDKENVARDIASYRDAPPGLRIWCGATVETADVKALMPWLDWAFATAIAQRAKAA
ncbi:MAG: phosphoserine aminotransferase, partial [Pseudomonadota bacterium]|nr:phosphoserine aminotransferase [Pseudomonadota bacterium]